MSRRSVEILAIASLALCLGCSGPESTVQGTVTIDGELAKHGTVVFHAVDGGAQAYGTIGENGTYSLRVGKGVSSEPDGGGLRSGEYIVTTVVNMMPDMNEQGTSAEPPMPRGRLTAKKYASKETSDLRVTVNPGLNIVPLELEGTSADEAAMDEADKAANAQDPAVSLEQAEVEDTPAVESANDHAAEANVSIEDTAAEAPLNQEANTEATPQ